MSIITATKKPVTISAVLWTGKNLLEVIRFTGQNASATDYKWEDYEQLVKDKGLKIFTLEGDHMASVGDYIIKGVKGEHYPCKPDIFEMTYNIGGASERSLLLEIIEGKKMVPAPIKTTRTPDHKEFIVEIGCDHTASIIIHDDALKELSA